MRALVVAAVLGGATLAHASPPRPLPQPSSRPAVTTRVFHVSPAGDDKADGSTGKPWKSIAHAVTRLTAGDTLYLHRGTYFERVTLAATGTAAGPITIRSAPGELAILDGGIPEFQTSPSTAWEPMPGGAKGEYRSTATYAIPASDVSVNGNFVDTMVPLHGYRFATDLRTDNEYWIVDHKLDGTTGVYLGPGVWFDAKTQRIHVRLQPTRLRNQPNYSGATDPRKLPLVIGREHTPLKIERARHVRIQDLVIRGSVTDTVVIAESSHVELDGVTVFGGAPAMVVRSTTDFRLVGSVLRGRAAPWSSRQSMKYRGQPSYLFVAGSKTPQNARWELAYNEFTDDHDGVVIDSVKTLRFHHNLVDNFNDDGLYLTLLPRDALPDDVHVYENLITRTYTALAFGDRGSKLPNAIGTGFHVFRNIFDLREGAYTEIPKDANAEQAFRFTPNRMCGDHGSPIWDPVFFYQNTVITAEKAWRDYYGAAMIIKAQSSQRRLFNNIFIQANGLPGLNVSGQTSNDLEIDGNLYWSVSSGAATSSDQFFKKLRRAPGFAANDVFGDPKLAGWATKSGATDARLSAGSAAIDAGVEIPRAWPDPLRARDKGKPDIGALPAGAAMLKVGPRGR